MKYWSQFFTIVLIGIVASHCSSGPTTEIPEDLTGKKNLLKQKRTELKELKNYIAALEEQITALEPSNAVKNVKLVTTKVLSTKEFKKFVEIQGSIQAEDLVDATSESPGRIILMPLKEGDIVRKGQLIAKLDMEQLDRQIAELNKSLELATTVYERQKRLWDQNIGSEIQYLEAKNNKERLEKSLETIQHQTTKAEVYAPISGTVERVILQSGEVAAPGAPILQILNTNKLKVVADVPENLLRSVRRGDLVTVQFPALGIEQRVRISQIGRTIDPSNRTFEVEAALNRSTNLLKPNLLAILLINDFSAENAIAVPVEAVLQEVSGNDYVFIKSEKADELIAKKVFIETGESYQGEILVNNGLKPGQELILEGARGLNENELIEISTRQ